MKRKRLTADQKRLIIGIILIVLVVFVIPAVKEYLVNHYDVSHSDLPPASTITAYPSATETPGLTLITNPPTGTASTGTTALPSQELDFDPADLYGDGSDIPFSLNEIPAFSGDFYVAVHNNEPYFTDNQIKTVSFEYYAPLDSLGRCTTTVACIGKDLMPTEKRGEIGSVKPSGWKNHPYEFVDGRYVYNRCHLIGYQLTAENANPCNLVTGTRSLNVTGMLPFENMTADYIKSTNQHVMYRVTPIFNGDELVCRGILMEGYSVEDNGAGLEFCVFCYNVEPGVTIDYSTGENWLTENGK
jgi:hypothetical protein